MLIVVLLGAKADIENFRLLQWIYETVPLGSLLQRSINTVHFYRNSLGTLFRAVLLSFAGQLISICVALSVAAATSPSGADIKMVMLIPLGYLANALPITPGGIGVGEVAMESLFSMFSLEGGAVVLLGWRVLLIIISLLGLYYYLKGEKRFVFHDNEPTDQA